MHLASCVCTQDKSVAKDGGIGGRVCNSKYEMRAELYWERVW